ncbi:MAG TPA: carboxypeptidase regulatory-like domain-containing protein [Gemmatimonadaceae bacterium]
MRLLACLPGALVALLALRPEPLLAQQPPAGERPGVIVGTVHDSLAGTPLRGATVQVAGTGPRRDVLRSAPSGAGGRFVIPDLPPGRFLVGFLHPALEGLGVDLPPAAVVVAAGDTVAIELAVPSAQGLRVAACGDGPRGAPAAMIGVVRDAVDRAPLAGTIVQSTWLEYDVGRGTVTRRRAGASDTTGATGGFALCDLPRGGSFSVRMLHGRDTSAIIDLDLPETGLLRRDLLLGHGWPGPGGASRPVRDAAGPRTLEGEGRLHGRVVSSPGGLPLAGVVVAVEGGPATRSDEEGRWSLAAVPTGTRMLALRGVGLQPRRVAVDVVAEPQAVDAGLAQLRAVLDTVRVTASRWRLEGTGFEERRRSTAGRFITPADLLRSPILLTSDLFRMMPGMRVDPSTLGETRITMRGPFGRCAPAVYIDGLWMQSLSAEDIDAFVGPDEVAGIEVYSGGYVPPQFQPPFAGCGSIVIWTKAAEHPARGWSARRRTLHGLAAVVVGAVIGIVFAHQ